MTGCHDSNDKYVTFDVLTMTRQAIEAWQRGCETKVNILSRCVSDDEKRISAIVKTMEQNSIEEHPLIKALIENVNKLLEEVFEPAMYDIKSKLPSISELNKIAQLELEKIHEHQTAQVWFDKANELKSTVIHLEKCLNQKNILLKSCEDDFTRCRNDLNSALINDRLSRSENTKLKKEVESLLNQLKSYQSNSATAVHSGGKAGGFDCSTQVGTNGGSGGVRQRCCPSFPHPGACADERKTTYY